MGFEITPTAVQLRELLPDVAASMEEKLVRVQMASLKIEHAYYRRNKTLVIEIPLTNNFYMRLSPVDVGPGNYHEFFSVVKTPAMRHIAATGIYSVVQPKNENLCHRCWFF